MNTSKITGVLLITGAIAVLIPYTILTIRFNYPDILRQDAGTVLTAFEQGGAGLIMTWWAFALSALPLLIAYTEIGKQLEPGAGFMKWVTTLGVLSLLVQMIGLLRWVFVIPVIATVYTSSEDHATKEAAIMAFKTIHQFGGVLLGEHIGQLFTIIWTIAVSYALLRWRIFSRWISLFGIGASLVYLAAQAELFATVIPGLVYWSMAGFAGSTLWLVWLIVLGVMFIKRHSLR